jgi:hypothetical protein
MRAHCFALLMMLSVSAGLHAEQANALTAKEIADGWLLLFDGTTTCGWTVAGKAEVIDGALVLGGEQETTARTNTAFGRMAVSFDAKLEGAAGLKVDLGGVEEGLPPAAVSGGAKCAFVREAAATRGPIQFRVPAGAKLALKNVKLLPLGLKPLFNAKDLDGWKVVMGSKASFTAAGAELKLKDGPGDLQTTEQWADFILQLDIKTASPQMNSGVLVRGQPNEYGSGYEVQVRNQWQGEDRTKVVDYGTGGVYNRVPARKIVGNAGEWLTETIIAEGRHFAIWVNGYPVCEYTDARAIGKTATQGCKLDKGPLSLHGDDHNLDVSFRNIKLAELPKAK